ncbi:MAG: MFS transporter [Staphylothermus sp.]|nr:MFS transporter [Staphylothermus sp.]
MSNNGKNYLNKNIIGLSLTSLLTDISSESVYAVIPFYIKSLGYGREIIGLIDGVGELTASIFKYLSGFIAQRVGRLKLLTVIGYSLSAFSKPFFALTKHWLEIMIIKIIDRIGKGIRTSPRDTLLASSASKEFRGRAFGLHRALDTIGAALGPLMAIFLLMYFKYVGVFLFSIIPGSLAVLILFCVVKDIEYKPSKKSSIEAEKYGFDYLFWLFITSIVIGGLAGYTQSFLLIRSNEIGWSEEFSIAFLVLSNLFYASLAYPVGYMSDLIGGYKLYPLVFALQSLGSFFIVVTTNHYTPIIFFLIYGAYMAFHDTLMRIMTSTYVKKYLRAKAYGIMHGSYGLSALLGYYIVGRLYDVYGYKTAFTYTSLMSILGLIISIVLIYKTHSKIRG